MNVTIIGLNVEVEHIATFWGARQRLVSCANSQKELQAPRSVNESRFGFQNTRKIPLP